MLLEGSGYEVGVYLDYLVGDGVAFCLKEIEASCGCCLPLKQWLSFLNKRSVMKGIVNFLYLVLLICDFSIDLPHFCNLLAIFLLQRLSIVRSDGGVDFLLFVWTIPQIGGWGVV